MLEKLAFSIPAPTSELFDLCGPEFSALKDQVADATGRREIDISAYTSLLHEAIKQVRVSLSQSQPTAFCACSDTSMVGHIVCR